MSGGDVVAFRPRGHYLAHEVGRLAGVSGDRIGQWARRGYIQSSQSTGRPRIYSYQDVAEAIVVHQLERADVPLREIRAAIHFLAVEYGDWPLSHAPLATASTEDERGKVAQLLRPDDDGGYRDLRKNPWQKVMDLGHVQKVARGLSRGGWAAMSLPDLQHVEVHPDRLSGRPAVRGSRVPAELVARMASREGGRAVLMRDYDLTSAQIRDATRWWAEVRKFEAQAA